MTLIGCARTPESRPSMPQPRDSAASKVWASAAVEGAAPTPRYADLRNPRLGDHGLDSPSAPNGYAIPLPRPLFDRPAAAMALHAVNVNVCRLSGGPTGSGHIRITFSPDGTIQSAVIDQPPFADNAVGACIAEKFRAAAIPAFAGAPVTVGKSFVVE
jgi:hypothetical protein